MFPLSFCLPHAQQTQIPPSATSYFDFSPPTLWITNHHMGRPLPPLKKIYTHVLHRTKNAYTHQGKTQTHDIYVKPRRSGALSSPSLSGIPPALSWGGFSVSQAGLEDSPLLQAFPLSLTSPFRSASQSRVRLDPFSLPARPQVTYWQINTMSTTCKCSLYMIREA